MEVNLWLYYIYLNTFAPKRRLSMIFLTMLGNEVYRLPSSGPHDKLPRGAYFHTTSELLTSSNRANLSGNFVLNVVLADSHIIEKGSHRA